MKSRKGGKKRKRKGGGGERGFTYTAFQENQRRVNLDDAFNHFNVTITNSIYDRKQFFL